MGKSKVAIVLAFGLLLAACQAIVQPSPIPTSPSQPTSTTSPAAPPNPGDGRAREALAALDRLATEASTPPTAYDRQAHFGGWIDADSDCQDTRAEVLIAESTVPVTFTGLDECRVSTGRWHDPYTGELVTIASSLDVDHLVPLEAAWRAGAWTWMAERRFRFTNDLDDVDHLVAVTASANRSKGSRGPDEWLPPLESYHCTYAIDWVDVKVRWSLTVTSAERDSLQFILNRCN